MPAALMTSYADTEGNNLHFGSNTRDDTELLSLYVHPDHTQKSLYIYCHKTNCWSTLSDDGNTISPAIEPKIKLTLVTNYWFLYQIDQFLCAIDKQLEESAAAKKKLMLRNHELKTTIRVEKIPGALVRIKPNKTREHLMIYLIKKLINRQHQDSLNLKALFS